MGGLGALIVIGVYLVIAYKVVTAIKGKKARYAVIALFVLLPTADALIGRLYLRHLCATEGGVKVHRTVDGVEGFLYDVPDKHWIEQYGYSFSEGQLQKNGHVNRYELKDGKITLEWDVPSKSVYRVRLVNTGDKDLYGKTQHIVSVAQTGEVLATYTRISFRGGWAERLIAGFSDAGVSAVAWCNMERSAAEEWKTVVQTITQTLTPKK